jgi:hypothetical protein
MKEKRYMHKSFWYIAQKDNDGSDITWDNFFMITGKNLSIATYIPKNLVEWNKDRQVIDESIEDCLWELFNIHDEIIDLKEIDVIKILNDYLKKQKITEDDIHRWIEEQNWTMVEFLRANWLLEE